jgi:hypothetical protein
MLVTSFMLSVWVTGFFPVFSGDTIYGLFMFTLSTRLYKSDPFSYL